MGLRAAWLGTATVLAAVLATETPAIAQSAAGVWALEGVVTLRGGGVKETAPITGTLTLDVDRTYTLEDDGDPLIEEGVWFQDERRVFLHTTNLLEIIMAMEDEASVSLGEPVELVPTKSTATAAIDSRTGALSIRTGHAYKVLLLDSGASFSVRSSAKLTGMRRQPLLPLIPLP